MKEQREVMAALRGDREFRAMQAGKRAGLDRKPSCDNPFPPDLAEHRAWETGRYTEELRRMEDDQR